VIISFELPFVGAVFEGSDVVVVQTSKAPEPIKETDPFADFTQDPDDLPY
jgi:hypothetical protein